MYNETLISIRGAKRMMKKKECAKFGSVVNYN